jgi:SAM-dependent methyltransferase
MVTLRIAVNEYVKVNRAFWDERVAAHAASPDYAVARFAEDPEFLSEVVRFDLPRLGDISGLTGVHLQCHIGTDTVSLERLGAHMTGLDMSAPALRVGRTLAAAAGAETRFVEAEVYDALGVLEPASFDLVYTGVGALNWLPDIAGWARVVAGLLRPGGRLHLREGHPVLWAIDPLRSDGLVAIEYPYFETAEAVILDDGEEHGTTYVETDQVFVSKETHEWNHGLSEIVTALLESGMELTLLEEHLSVPWEGLPGMADRGDGEWQLVDRPERLPHSYTLQARRR